MKRQRPGSAPQAKKKPALSRQNAVVGNNYQAGREFHGHPKQELKAFDVAQGNSTMASAGTGGTFALLNAMVNGAELYNRVGRRVMLKSTHIRGQCIPAATSTGGFGRVILFYDAQPNAAAPTLANLLADSNAAHATNLLSEINLDNRERFKIFRDIQFLLPPLTFTAGVITNLGQMDQVLRSLQINEFVKLGKVESVYNGTNGGTIADITSGSLYLLFLSTDGSWNFNWTSRTRYYD